MCFRLGCKGVAWIGISMAVWLVGVGCRGRLCVAWQEMYPPQQQVVYLRCADE
jgi:hypothetical protein